MLDAVLPIVPTCSCHVFILTLVQSSNFICDSKSVPEVPLLVTVVLVKKRMLVFLKYKCSIGVVCSKDSNFSSCREIGRGYFTDFSGLDSSHRFVRALYENEYSQNCLDMGGFI